MKEPLTKPMKPLANRRLRLDKLHPQGHYCVVRIDPVKEKTDSGLVLPGANGNGRLGSQFAGADMGRGAPGFKYDLTAVVLLIGPEVDNVEVGERVLLNVHTLPVEVADAAEEHPLGLFDSRDISCKVGD